jgi:hypothetical protein
VLPTKRQELKHTQIAVISITPALSHKNILFFPVSLTLIFNLLSFYDQNATGVLQRYPITYSLKNYAFSVAAVFSFIQKVTQFLMIKKTDCRISGNPLSNYFPKTIARNIAIEFWYVSASELLPIWYGAVMQTSVSSGKTRRAGSN